MCVGERVMDSVPVEHAEVLGQALALLHWLCVRVPLLEREAEPLEVLLREPLSVPVALTLGQLLRLKLGV